MTQKLSNSARMKFGLYFLTRCVAGVFAFQNIHSDKQVSLLLRLSLIRGAETITSLLYCDTLYTTCEIVLMGIPILLGELLLDRRVFSDATNLVCVV